MTFCAASAEARAMGDGEFWEHVARSILGEPAEYDHSHEAIDVGLSSDPCPVCGAVNACGWDAEGLPLIHAVGDR